MNSTGKSRPSRSKGRSKRKSDGKKNKRREEEDNDDDEITYKRKRRKEKNEEEEEEEEERGNRRCRRIRILLLLLFVFVFAVGVGAFLIAFSGSSSGDDRDSEPGTTESARGNGTRDIAGLQSNAKGSEASDTVLSDENSGDWGEWSDCSETCGVGTKTRSSSSGAKQEARCYMKPCFCSFVVISDEPDKVYKMHDGGTLEDFRNSADAQQAAYDPVNDNIYWTRKQTKSIAKDGNMLYNPGKDMSGITLDFINRLMFAAGNNYGIMKAKYEEQEEPTWIVVGVVKTIWSMAHISDDKVLYWIDTRLKTIEKCDYDGQNRQIIWRSGKSIRGLAIDSVERIMYFMEIEGARVFISSLDKFSRRSPYQEYDGAVGHALALCGEYVFVADAATDGGKVYRINKGGDREPWPDKQIPGVTSITIYGLE